MKIYTKREQAEQGDFDEQYAEYIMDHAGGDRIICNGDTLTCAMEDGYLWEDFLESIGAK